MKKIFLTVIALLSMASASVFGMYRVDTDWIFFLTHGNQFRARLYQLGYGGSIGNMLNTLDGKDYNFTPTISMGIGYTSSLIGIGVGYNATIGNKIYKFNGKSKGKPTQAVGHTPVLVLNALDNAFRMAIPIQVYVDKDKYANDAGSYNITAVSVDSQFRYYTGLEMLPQVRLYLRYGGVSSTVKAGETTTKSKGMESFGFDFRLYFGAMVEEVALQPYVKLDYNGTLGKYHNVTRVEAVKYMRELTTSEGARWEKSAWDLQLVAGLGLTANSDIVSLYLEPTLGLKVNQYGSATDKNVKEVYGLGYGVYAEIYITPLKNLEWYFEAGIGNDASYNSGNGELAFNGSTGITWYLPAL